MRLVSGGVAPSRSKTKPSPNRSMVERPSASQACGAREPGHVEGTNCAVSAAGMGASSGAQIGEPW
jgi:hypothetical protein